MIKRLINKILKSINNLPAQYKVALARILTGIMESIMALEENKVDKEEGKELSSNDFTDELKDKLENLPEEFIQENADWESESGVTKILNKPDLTVYPDSAEWDKTTKKIYFKNQGTILNPFTIDGTDFIKDGMIDEVKIENDKLVIIFNTDSGKERIEIPLSEIFNPDNYYTKVKTDELFVKKVNGKDLSSNDFTDELKEKLENLTGSDSLILHYDCSSNGYNYEGDRRENIINNQKLINDFIAAGGDSKKIIALFNFSVKTLNGNNENSYPYPAGPAIGINFRQEKNIERMDYIFEIISFKTIYYNPYHKTKRIARYGSFIGSFIIQYNGDRYIDAFTHNYTPREELVTLTTVNKLLGNITSYTNEEIEQLIAEGYDVKVFKLNITEDKTLLQQILVDNPEDGSIDITQALYFVYDSAKDKYYDVNSLIIDTVEDDRQINIVGGLGKLDYTAIKINADDAEYIVNPSHVEGGNSDWNENDEDKSSYIKNRTHYIDNNVVYPLDSKYLENLTDEEINQILE